MFSGTLAKNRFKNIGITLTTFILTSKAFIDFNKSINPCDDFKVTKKCINLDVRLLKLYSLTDNNKLKYKNIFNGRNSCEEINSLFHELKESIEATRNEGSPQLDLDYFNDEFNEFMALILMDNNKNHVKSTIRRAVLRNNYFGLWLRITFYEIIGKPFEPFISRIIEFLKSGIEL